MERYDKVIITLRSGRQLKLKAKKVRVRRRQSGELMSYSIEGVAGPLKLTDIDMREVVAIFVSSPWWTR